MKEVWRICSWLFLISVGLRKWCFTCSAQSTPLEHLDDDTLKRIAQEYMEELGYGGQPYIVFKHWDIAREHIHIVSIRVDSEGRKVNDRFEKLRSKRITNDLEEKYGLILSVLRRRRKREALFSHGGGY